MSDDNSGPDIDIELKFVDYEFVHVGRLDCKRRSARLDRDAGKAAARRRDAGSSWIGTANARRWLLQARRLAVHKSGSDKILETEISNGVMPLLVSSLNILDLVVLAFSAMAGNH